MPHLLAHLMGEEARTRARAVPPFGPGLDEEVISRMFWLKITGSGILDSGPDWTEFTAHDAAGDKITSKRIEGY